MNNNVSNNNNRGLVKAKLMTDKGPRLDFKLAKINFDNYLKVNGFSTGVVEFALGVGLMKNINKV